MDLYLERDVGLRKMVILEKLDIVHLGEEKYEKEEVDVTSKRGDNSDGAGERRKEWTPQWEGGTAPGSGS